MKKSKQARFSHAVDIAIETAGKASIVILVVFGACLIFALLWQVVSEAAKHYNDPEHPFSGATPDSPVDYSYYPHLEHIEHIKH